MHACKRVEANTSPVTILVLNFNGKSDLKKCLDSLLTTNYPHFGEGFVLVMGCSTSAHCMHAKPLNGSVYSYLPASSDMNSRWNNKLLLS